MSFQKRLTDMLEPTIEMMGYELLLVEYESANTSTIRIYIDGPNGINVDDCSDVSRQVSGVLDVEDPISGKYTLEVSSPGVDRPLTKRQHFEEYTGNRVRVKTETPSLEGRRNFTGMLTGLDGDEIIVEVDGENQYIAIADIERARLVPEFD